jgi:type I restriction enzyme M protein
MNLNLNQLSVFIYEFDENLIVKFTLRVTLLRSFLFQKKPSKKTSNIKNMISEISKVDNKFLKKNKKEIKEKAIEVTLWEAANKLRGSVEPAEYKHVVLGLIFLKFASDKFEEHRAKLIADGKEKYIEKPEFYNMNNVFFLEETSRWSYLIKRAKQNDIALLIDTALHVIEKNNKALKGALPDNYFSRLGLDVTKLASLLDTINDIDTTKDPKHDVVGKVYEYFLSKFALAEGKGKGEFYTPKSIVNLIAEMIEPYKGIIYDPACGSGGMFVQSIKFIEAHNGNNKEISIYGQEYTNTTYKLAKMNLAIRGISGNLGEKAADTFADDQHKDLKADFIMANPPFNQKDWRAENELKDDPRWRGYDVPPKSNANYGWILNMVSKLSENGIAGFILANGALSGGGEEYKIRRKLIENNLVEAILVLPRNLFYTTDISVTLWILNKNKKTQSKNIGDEKRQYRDREKEILFMDLRQLGEPFEKKYTQFSDDDIKKVTSNYHQWQTKEIENIPEFCYSASLEEVAKKDFSLVPSKYIEFVNRDENIDFDEKMETLKGEFADLLKSEASSKNDLLTVFKELGYEIKL